MAIWHGNPTLEQLVRMHRNTLAERIGIVITGIGDDYLRATMPADARTFQPMGIVHGGANVALAETVASVAAGCCIDRERFGCVGQEINANHLRSVSSGMLTATARPFHIGRRSQVWGIEIVDDAGQLTCISRITIAVVERRAPSGA